MELNLLDVMMRSCQTIPTPSFIRVSASDGSDVLAVVPSP